MGYPVVLQRSVLYLLNRLIKFLLSLLAVFRELLIGLTHKVLIVSMLLMLFFLVFLKQRCELGFSLCRYIRIFKQLSERIDHLGLVLYLLILYKLAVVLLNQLLFDILKHGLLFELKDFLLLIGHGEL